VLGPLITPLIGAQSDDNTADIAGYPTLEGNVLDEALMEDEGFEIPKQNPNKHDDPEAG
jgi:hypothetical protein